jgi:hypothetical protein
LIHIVENGRKRGLVGEGELQDRQVLLPFAGFAGSRVGAARFDFEDVLREDVGIITSRIVGGVVIVATLSLELDPHLGYVARNEAYRLRDSATRRQVGQGAGYLSACLSTPSPGNQLGSAGQRGL